MSVRSAAAGNLRRNGVHAFNDASAANLTTCAWYKRKADTNNFATGCYVHNQGGNYEFFVETDSGGDAMHYFEIPAPETDLTGPSLTIDTWIFVLTTRTNGSQKIYWGTESGGSLSVASATDTRTVTSNIEDVWLFDDVYGEPANMEMVYFRMWDASMNATEADSEWRSTTPVKSGVLVDLRLAAASSAGTDSSGNGFTFTTSGTLTNGGSDPTPPASGGTTYTVDLAGTLTSSGGIAKQDNKILAGTFTSSGLLLKQASKLFAGILTSSGLLSKRVQKVFAGILASAGFVIKQDNKTLSGALSSSGLLNKQVNKIFSGALPSSGALTRIKTAVLNIAGTLTSSGTIVKQDSKLLSGTFAPTGALIKQDNKILSGTLSSSGLLTRIKTAILNTGGTLSSSGALSKQVSHLFSGTLAPVGGLAKRTSKIFSGVLSSFASLFAVKTGGTVIVAGFDVYDSRSFAVQFVYLSIGVIYGDSELAVYYSEQSFDTVFSDNRQYTIYGEIS